MQPGPFACPHDTVSHPPTPQNTNDSNVFPAQASFHCFVQRNDASVFCGAPIRSSSQTRRRGGITPRHREAPCAALSVPSLPLPPSRPSA